jgi:hypothetical protein
MTESPNVSGDDCSVMFVLTLFVSPFKPKSRLGYPARRSRSKSAFENEVKYERTFTLFPNMTLGEKVARFR